MSSIKVDVISGFLGAGKTTLLSMYAAYRIKQGEKIAVIENEFGEIGIDSLFLENEGLSVYEIVNGCICCSLKGDIISTLKGLAEKGSINRVLIEPTGIFMLNEIYEIIKAQELSKYYEIGTVVTVVDARNYLKQRKKYDWFFSNQIKWAHRLVLSKTDSVDRDTLLLTMQAIQEMPDTPDIITGEWKSFKKEEWEKIFSGGDNLNTACECSNENHCHCHEGSHQHEDRHDGFEGISIPCNRIFSKYTLEQTVRMLSTGMFGDIPRAKGIVANEERGSIEFDYVEGDLDIRYKEQALDKGVISFIGTGIQRGPLTMLFKDI